MLKRWIKNKIQVIKRRKIEKLVFDSGLFDEKYYFETYLDVNKDTVSSAVSHFLSFGSVEGRNPNPYFSTLFYRDNYLDVSSSNQNEFLHFLATASIEKRCPSELFDTVYYMSQYQNVDFSQINPLKHYIDVGRHEMAKPHPLFDPVFYRAQLGLKNEISDDLLLHYITKGEKLGFRPNPYFDPVYYKQIKLDDFFKSETLLYHYCRIGWQRSNNPSIEFNNNAYLTQYRDVKSMRMNPLVHFLEIGQREGRTVKASSYFQNYLPNILIENSSFKTTHRRPISVIVPIYRNLEITKVCIESVLNAKTEIEFELILIEDKSPETEVGEYLRILEGRKNVRVFFNNENLGFVKTVNFGMSLDKENDVLLLNSDTQVDDGWLDRIAFHAYSSDKVSTVTPLSNNATICSYPSMTGSRSLPEGETLRSMNQACWAANRGRSTEIPTGVGFCMYIRRDSLNSLGEFDSEAFGKGYGEENDFCMRAINQGYKHLLAYDVFVFHQGDVSFGETSKPSKLNAEKIILQRYPDYNRIVAAHISRDEGRSFRDAITAMRFRNSGKPTHLIVTHPFGGGTDKHIGDLVRYYQNQIQFVIMKPDITPVCDGSVILTVSEGIEFFQLDIVPSVNFDFFVKMLQSFSISKVHVHHLMGYSFSIRKLIRELNLPFDFTVHDYYSLCPQVTFFDYKKKYCGEPNALECLSCLDKKPVAGVADIYFWRSQMEWLFLESENILVPSVDTYKRVKKYYPKVNVVWVPHDLLTTPLKPSMVRPNPLLSETEIIRIAVLGSMVGHKGIYLVNDVLKETVSSGARLEFFILGSWDSNVSSIEAAPLNILGTYKEEELSSLLERVRPHILWYPSQCPETYSYTLDIAIENGYPVAATNLGAYQDRLNSREWTWFLDWRWTAKEIVSVFNEEIRTSLLKNSAPSAQFFKSSDVVLKKDFYSYQYALPAFKKSIIDLREKDVVSVMMVVETNQIGGVEYPNACAYIRVLLPNLYSENTSSIRFHFIPYDLVTSYRADILLTHRMPFPDMNFLNQVLIHIEKMNMAIIYDLDDNLIQIDTEHIDFRYYQERQACVLRFLLSAQLVTVSTHNLMDIVSQWASKVMLLPNRHDGKFWLPRVRSNKSKNESVSILLMGTSTHTDDLVMIYESIRNIKTEFGDQVSFKVIGFANDQKRFPDVEFIVPPDGKSEYPLFIKWLQSLGEFDIGLAPLRDSPFNNSKSILKFIDYIGLGVVPLCSKVGSYYRELNLEASDFLVDNTTLAWETRMRELIVNKALRDVMLGKAQDLYQKYFKHTETSSWVSEYFSYFTTIYSQLQNESKSHFKKIKLTSENSNMDRLIVARAFLVGEGIEIGALHNPLVIGSQAHVKYVDRMNKEELLVQYPELCGVKLVDVDIIDSGETLYSLADKSQDFLIANHFIEHSEDPIRTLKNFCRVVRLGGYMFIAIPDKLRTFDVNRERTTLDHVIADYSNGAQISRFEHYIDWVRNVEPLFGRSYPTNHDVNQRARELEAMSYSIHFHVWRSEDIVEMIHYCKNELKFPLQIKLVIENNDEIIVVIQRTSDDEQIFEQFV